MAYLLLDLDGTATCNLLDEDKLHPSHILTDYLITFINGHAYYNAVINPVELAELIEYAYKEHDGVVFLTSGAWNAYDTIELLISKLKLPSRINTKLRNSHFHSTATDIDYYLDNTLSYEQNLAKVKSTPKNERLAKIKEVKPELRYKHFAFLDDTDFQCRSFKNDPTVIAQRATTSIADNGDKSFYKKTMANLAQAKLNEESAALKGTPKDSVSTCCCSFFCNPFSKASNASHSLVKKKPVDEVKLGM